MEKLLITGANGFVGSRIAHAVHTHYDLLTPSHSECDITSAKAVEVYVRQHRPQAILHLAALSNTGYCEEHPEASYQVNVVGVENIAAAAARFDAKLVFFSSDQVYNGNCEQGLLSEEITLSPENHYGRHKRMAEVRALQLCPNSVALRATWMYDNTREGMPTHNNFVRNIKEALRLHTPLHFATREYRGITWINEVVHNILHTFQLPGGIYNFGAENTLNTYETALAYLAMLSPDAHHIAIADHERFSTHVRNISISMNKAREASSGAIQFANTIEGLRLFEDTQQ